jgi:hypothetical protein
MYCKQIAEQKSGRIFFHGAKGVFLESARQLEEIKQLAEQYDFDIESFSFYEYGAVKLQEFVSRIEKEISSEIAQAFVFSLINGAAHWGDVLSDLDILKLIHDRCAEALTKDKEKNLADIVWLEIRQLNNRLPGQKIYDSSNRTLHGLLSRIRRGVARGKTTLADCKPLTILFYLTMLSFGQKTELHLAEKLNKDGDIDGHVYSSVIINGKEIIYENTAVEYTKRNIPANGLYNDRTVNIWAVLAEEIVTKLKEPLPLIDYSKSEVRVGRKPLAEGTQSMKVLEQIRIFDRDNTSVLFLLSEKYDEANRLMSPRGTYSEQLLNTVKEWALVYYDEFLKNEKTRDKTTMVLCGLYNKLSSLYNDNCSRFDLTEIRNLLDKLSAMLGKN